MLLLCRKLIFLRAPTRPRAACVCRNPGAPSQDFLLSAPEVASKVTGNEPEQVTLPEEFIPVSECICERCNGLRVYGFTDAALCCRCARSYLALVRAQIHMTQGATPADMYISWVTGNASYTYCSQDDNATCGDATNACYCNESPAAFTSSQVKYSTDGGLENAVIGQEAGDYPVTVRTPVCSLIAPVSRDAAASAPHVQLLGLHLGPIARASSKCIRTVSWIWPKHPLCYRLLCISDCSAHVCCRMLIQSLGRSPCSAATLSCTKHNVNACAQNQYVQYYGPMATGNNYTSGLLHTIKLTGLTPNTQYYYQCVNAPHRCTSDMRAASRTVLIIWCSHINA